MLVAVAQVESQMTPGGRSPSDARGLLQVLPLALAAYNAGPTAVADAGGAPTQETLEYVANVTSLWRKLRDCR
jgi:soluble lytic murein transglycosylase-like protein